MRLWVVSRVEVQLPPADVRADAFAYLTRRAMKTGKAEPSKSKRCTVLPSSDNQLYRFLVLQTSLSAEIISHRSFFLADSFQAIIYRCFFTHRQSRRVSRSYGEMMNNVVLLLSIENGQQLAYSCSPALLLPSSTCLSRHRHPSIHPSILASIQSRVMTSLVSKISQKIFRGLACLPCWSDWRIAGEARASCPVPTKHKNKNLIVSPNIIVHRQRQTFIIILFTIHNEDCHHDLHCFPRNRICFRSQDEPCVQPCHPSFFSLQCLHDGWQPQGWVTYSRSNGMLW